jgi:rSAM/selenodomain-associated transferase 2
MTLAVVLPALNEAAALAQTLETIRNQSRPPERLLVVDGGSTDDTVAVAERSGAEVVVATGRGRGGQIAAGVAKSCEEIIVVAHADMVFPPAAFRTIRDFLTRHPGCPGGCLGHRFDNPKRVLRAIEWWDRRRAMRGHSYGDQVQFFRREMLESAGGFPDLPLMEDVEVARRLRRLGRPAYLDLPVTVSARRYERLGWPRVMYANWRLRRAYERSGPEVCWSIFQRYYGTSVARFCIEMRNLG